MSDPNPLIEEETLEGILCNWHWFPHFLKETFWLQRNIDFHIFSKNHYNGKDKWISTFSKRIILIAKKHFDWEETFWLQRGHSVIDINFQVFSKMVKQLDVIPLWRKNFIAPKYLFYTFWPKSTFAPKVYPDFASLLWSKITCFNNKLCKFEKAPGPAVSGWV